MLTGGFKEKLLRCFQAPVHAANETIFYSTTYYRVPQTDEFAALGGGENDTDELGESQQGGQQGGQGANKFGKKFRYDDVEEDYQTWWEARHNAHGPPIQ